MRYLIIFLSLFLMGDEIKEELLKVWDDISNKEYQIIQNKLKGYREVPVEVKLGKDKLFKIYIKNDQLVYIKKDCLDKESPFFLHFFQDKKYYKNFDFLSTELFYYKNFCIGYRKLPDISFKWMDTGQYKGNERVWWVRIKKEDLESR